MFNNVGLVDRIIRLILASVLAYFGLLIYSGSALGIGLTIAGRANAPYFYNAYAIKVLAII
ncbi:MAG: YgaP-like transmembrane domain [Waterburya sp.]